MQERIKRKRRKDGQNPEKAGFNGQEYEYLTTIAPEFTTKVDKVIDKVAKKAARTL
jgi:hypothetical protein